MTRRPIPPAVMIDTDTGEVRRGTVKELANAPFVICMDLDTPLVLPDNHIGTCGLCGRALQFRPNHPPGLIKLCVPCATAGNLTKGTG